ncbi:hypothetical protein [Akkermansia muciniphila]|uniref:hypothetical protein n=1 Tax=Akkermansia muciniphila TaxID=239935 RepID=UPI0021802A58|nr:hypothetical protein [Akkermansia muciniphila]
MRDLETISLALTAAETGLLVFAPCTRTTPAKPLTVSLTYSRLTSNPRCAPCLRVPSAASWRSS